MQSIYYLDTEFKKEDTEQYILSIRFSTDGLSFCIHDPNNRLMALVFRPYTLGSIDEITAKVKKSMVEDELLNLKYKKVFINPCTKDKYLLPAHIFNKDHLADISRLSLPIDKNDTIIYRKIKAMEAYMVETLPRNFITFLTARYQALCIVNSAYPFILNSLSSALLNTHHLFIDVYEHYFDLLICKDNKVVLFNSFQYSSITDLIYYTLLAVKKCNINKEKLKTVISGFLATDTKFYQMLSEYIPDISIITEPDLSRLLRNSEINTSYFVHMLSMHQCEL